MQRILFHLPLGDGIPVYGYGLFLMLGFLAALALACWRAASRGISRDSVMDVGLISIIAGVVGARLAFLLIDYLPDEGASGPAEWFAVWNGGLTLQGGLVLAIPMVWLYLVWKKIPVGKMLDIYAPALATGIGLGRIGCLMNGCCWGKPAPAGFPLGITFPPEIYPMAYQDEMAANWLEEWVSLLVSLGYPLDTSPPIHLYPTQIISALALFLIAISLIVAEKKWPHPDGQVVLWFIFSYSLFRFFIEFWRDDTPLRYSFGAFPGLRLGQWLALAMFLVGLFFQARLRWRQAPPPQAGQG
ncbi:MAG: prolipoprotein diacylglyceryl transferase [Planctomycetota bacterium]|jgi:phosphatidylglycerol:prolipoprotein diacylglycerol transferase|nr:prolipoprotein diacylglyceryl transferase [Planctomycetota bacterium]